MAGDVIVNYDLAAPTAWRALPLTPLDGPDGPESRRAIAALAAEMTTDAEAASRLEEVLVRAHPALVARPCLAIAVWVPDPIAGLPLGHLVVELLTGDGTTIDQYEANLDPTPRPGQEVLWFVTERHRLPAGEALVISTAGKEGKGEVEEVVTFVVFPDGTADGMQLTFATNALHLSDDLMADAWTIAMSLTVDLGPLE